MEQRSKILSPVVVVCSLSVFCFGNEQVRMTLFSINHFKSEEDSLYQCRLSDPDEDQHQVTVESLRTGWTRGTAEENPDPPDAVYSGEVSYPYHRVEMINNGSNNAFGVFACRATKAGKSETIISTTRMRSDAEIVPSNNLFTQTVSTGDRNVQITMVNTREELQVSTFRWRNNTYFWGQPHFGVNTFTINEPVQLYHAGIYECHASGRRSLAKHGLNLLIVRACPSTRWGPPDCEGVCDSCYNGGVCDENTGQCVCAPGFQGKNCLTACGRNRYGYTCDKRCTYVDDNKANCGGILFCLVHPFGCRCNTGFRGLDCEQACDENTFGASCLQSCHCSSDQCNRYTGECEGTDTSCDPGWTGEICQECTSGYFGSNCDQECHCSSDKCNRESGLCQLGGCLPQWIDMFPPYFCQTGIKNSAYTKVNAGVSVPVNCTAVEGSSGLLTGLDLVLSRSFNSLDETDVYLEDMFIMENTKTVMFKVEKVERNIGLFCQLRRNNERLAVLNVTIDVYDLPELLSAPNFVASTSTTITISWAAWDVSRNKGTPPVVGYNLYHKLSNETNWRDVQSYQGINGQDEYYVTVKDLDPDTLYDFSIAAVRAGTGGEGPRSPAIEEQRTACKADPPTPENVLASIVGDKQELVEISWQLPSEDVSCSAGVVMFTVYYSSSKDETSSMNVPDATALSFILADLTPGLSYTFHVTLSTSGGESEESTKVEKFIPVLPSLTNLPSLRSVTCNSVALVWQKWTNETDQGTPPIVHYIPYQRMNVSNDWISGDVVAHDDTVEEYQFTFWDLTEDTTYEFCVVVAREGYGGEGYKTRVVQQTTALCSDAPLSVYAMAASIGIPAVIFLIVIAAVVIVIMRCRNNSNGSPVPRITVEASYENTGPKASISLKENDRKPRTYEDKRPAQRNQAMTKQKTSISTVSSYDVFHSYENNNKNQISAMTPLDSEENPYEVPEDGKNVAHDC